MGADLLDDLPVGQRLALSYAPRSAREDTLTLLALDHRLAGVLRNRGEVIMAQMKLAWWRDRLRDDPANWPVGEPLLARLAQWSGDTALLVPLVDGWEALLAEQLDRAPMTEFADGRATAWAALAEGLGEGAHGAAIKEAARDWAMVDLALHLNQGDEAQIAREAAHERDWRPRPLPRPMRPLAVLRGLAGRALRGGRPELLHGPGAAMLALRLGLTGR